METYNERKPENKVNPVEYHLERSEGRILRGDETIHEMIKNRDDIYVKPGPSTFKHRKDFADGKDDATRQVYADRLCMQRNANVNCQKI